MSQHRAGIALAIVGFLFVAVATLTPIPGAPQPATTWCLVCGDLGGIDVIANVLLLIPLGIGLRLAGISLRRTVALCFALTLTVEILQLRVVVGRDASLSDVLMNTLGGWCGARLATHLRDVFAPDPPLAGKLARWSALALAVLLALSSWALRPALPFHYYWAQWTPQRPEYAPFAGRLLDVSVARISLANGFLPRSFEIREHLLRRRSEASATVEAGPPTPKLAVIARMANHLGVAFVIGQHGRALVCQRRFHTADLRVRTPELALADAFPDAEELSPVRPDTLRLICGVRDGWLYTRRESSSGARERAVPLSPGMAWMFLLPFSYSIGPRYATLNLVWLAALVVPLGFWSALAFRQRGTAVPFVQRPPSLIAAALLALFVGLALMPWLAGLPAIPFAEWGAAVAGWLIGAAAGALVARRVSAAGGGGRR
jgi:VanZ like protein